jgi:hypothetical protein
VADPQIGDEISTEAELSSVENHSVDSEDGTPVFSVPEGSPTITLEMVKAALEET